MKRFALLVLVLFLFAGGLLMAGGGQESPGTPAATSDQMTGGGIYKQAPMLDALVVAKTIPPVAERLPEKPKVEPMIDGIGRYGGDIHVYATGNAIWDDFQGMWGAALYRIPQSGIGIEGDLAEGYDINADQTEFTIHLRKGAKWSDGQPFTAEDIRFMYMDMIHNDKVTTWNSLPQVMDVKVIDDYTAVLVAPGGLGTLPLEIAGWQGGRSQGFQPAHYLKKWHIDYNPDAAKLAKEEGFDNWWSCMQSHYWWSPQTDLSLPLVTPWVLKTRAAASKAYERNPYFWRVDPNGNQLPYLDRIVVSIANPETYQLKISGGEADIAYTHTSVDNLSLYKTGEQAGNYKTVLFPGMNSSEFTLVVCQNYKHPAEQAILQNIKFRQAVSVAINRKDINDTLMFSLGTPSQVSPLKSAGFYKEGWAEYYAQFDPALAGRLLDEIGMSEKDKDGFRLMPNGQPFSLIIEYGNARNTGCSELLKEYFDNVGLRTTIKMEDAGLLDERLTAGEVMMWMTDGPNPPSSERLAFMSLWQWQADINRQWEGAWERAKADAVRKATGSDVLPANWTFMKTPDDKNIVGEDTIPDSWRQYYLDAGAFRRAKLGSPEYIDAGQKVFDFWVHNLYKIGTVGQTPAIMIVSNKLGNVIKPGWVKGIPLAAQLVQEWQDQVCFE